MAEAAAAIRALIAAASLPDEVAGPLAEAAAALAHVPGGEPLLLAARSSAVAEDGRASFAGQYESLLHVAPADAAAAYLRVVAGKYWAKAITYRALRGFADEETPMAVLFLPMLPAAASGVLYTRDSGDGEAPMAVYAVPGLGAGLMEGAASPERLALSHDPPHFLLDRLSLDGPILPEASARRLAAIGLSLEKAFGAPQDVEWVFTPGRELFVVQSRPMAVEAAEGEPADAPAPPAPPATPPLWAGGQRASGGAATGTVLFAATVLDVDTIGPGTVLVTPTLPTSLARAVDRLAAVVAVLGQPGRGISPPWPGSFGLPVVHGAEGAFEALSEGARVTVDADAGAVYPGRVEALLARSRQARADAGSPVARRLARLVPLLAGLTLTDPTSPDFAPAKVRSLHDVVRFAHEKAVTEMFSLVGDDARGLASARKVKSPLPMTMYLLDLGGGVFESAAADKKCGGPDPQRAHVGLVVGAGRRRRACPRGRPSSTTRPWTRTAPACFSRRGPHLASYAVISDIYAHVMLRFGLPLHRGRRPVRPQGEPELRPFPLQGRRADIAARPAPVCVRRVLAHFGFTVWGRATCSTRAWSAWPSTWPEAPGHARLPAGGHAPARHPPRGRGRGRAWVVAFIARTDR